jgi:methionyl-tRNA synthetase
VGSIPKPGDLTDADQELLAHTAKAFDTVGSLIERHRQKAALSEAMRVVGEVNKYVSDMAPWALRKTDPDRMATVLFVTAQAISDCNTLLAPFLPHSAQQVHQAFGRTSTIAPMPEIREVEDLDGGPAYPVLTSDYSDQHPWRSVPVEPGTPVPAPSPIFRKLDSSVIDEELARMRGEAVPASGESTGG